jgi:hypothetical protein
MGPAVAFQSILSLPPAAAIGYGTSRTFQRRLTTTLSTRSEECKRRPIEEPAVSLASSFYVIDCLGKALCGAEGQNRTVDTSLFRAVLYQLSYLGTALTSAEVVDDTAEAVMGSRVIDGIPRSSSNTAGRCRAAHATAP